MFAALVGQDKRSWLPEVSDGRRFVISGKDDATVRPKVRPAGSRTPIFGGRRLFCRAARGPLAKVLGKQPAAPA
jgi:hypothetical protein